MPQSVPTPVAAALGLVPAVLGGVRRLPGRAVQLPVLAVGSALSRLDAARREYDDLAARGERLIARLRGTSFDELEDRVEDSLQGTPLAKPYDKVEDALEDATEAVTGTVSNLTARVAQRAGRAAPDDDVAQARAAAEKAEQAVKEAAAKAAEAAERAASAAAEATPAEKTAAKKAAKKAAASPAAKAGRGGKGAPTPAATQPDSTRIDTAASPDVVQTVEQVGAQSGAGAVLAHDELPLPDYDHMTLGSLRGRLRSLTVEQLVQVRDYEKAHADRLPVVTMLDNRIAKLATDAGAAQPTGAPSEQPAPGQQVGTTGSKVEPSTGGPALSPPPQGNPAGRSQSR